VTYSKVCRKEWGRVEADEKECAIADDQKEDAGCQCEVCRIRLEVTTIRIIVWVCISPPMPSANHGKMTEIVLMEVDTTFI